MNMVQDGGLSSAGHLSNTHCSPVGGGGEDGSLNCIIMEISMKHKGVRWYVDNFNNGEVGYLSTLLDCAGG